MLLTVVDDNSPAATGNPQATGAGSLDAYRIEYRMLHSHFLEDVEDLRLHEKKRLGEATSFEILLVDE